jgi:hypothetical protein
MVKASNGMREYDHFNLSNSANVNRYSLWPGTAQNSIVRATVNAKTRTVTQMARPINSFLTYGSRIVRVRKGVVSDWRRKTRIGSSSYWCETKKRMANENGMKSYKDITIEHMMSKENGKVTYEKTFRLGEHV